MSLEDFQVLTAAHKSRRRSESFVRYADIIVFALAGLGAVVFALQGDWVYAGLCVGYIAALLAMRRLLEPWIVRRRFRMQSLDKSEFAMTADDAGVEILNGSVSSTIGWDGFARLDRRDGRTILWTPGIAGFAVPDRGFAKPEDAAAFHTLAMEKING
ncbi:MAG: YcxB family protein [Pseudomonadota bacterium]